MGSINKQISRFETTAVYTHPDAKADIVLVHGLNGDPKKTWTAKKKDGREYFWPADLLPGALKDVHANVLVYGYNADVYSKKHGSNPSDNYIHQHAQTLVTSLTHYRKDELGPHKPIIWVCHSLGGIMVKRALLYSNDLRLQSLDDYRSIYVSTYGIVFMGTPHTGSGLAGWGSMVQAMSDAVVPKAFFQSESVLLKTLKNDNETLQNINSHFLDIYQRFKIAFVRETQKTDLKGTKSLIVDAQSACPQLPGVHTYSVEATHSSMVKFDGRNAPGFKTISHWIRTWVEQAPEIIGIRWRVEQEEGLARAKHEMEERIKPWLNTQSIQQQQQQQQQQLQTTRRQTNDTIFATQDVSRIEYTPRPALPEPESSQALVQTRTLGQTQAQGPQGHQAEGSDTSSRPSKSRVNSSSRVNSLRQLQGRDVLFVKPTSFRPNVYFKGRDKEMQKLHKMLWDRDRRAIGTASVLIQGMTGVGKSHLARQYVFKHRNEYPGGLFWIRAKTKGELDLGYWDIAKAAGLAEAKLAEKDDDSATKKVVKAVQAWLNGLESWLLVLDGLHFDLPGVQDYIPFAKNTSMIFTSTERATVDEWVFDNPKVISLDRLSTKDAQELLLEGMGKKKPYTQDDISRARELVDEMDRLPLMINMAASQLKTTKEPLSKYLRTYRSKPPVAGLGAYQAVREQLEARGAQASLNLLYTLCFFGQHIPVEMVALGTKALDKRTPVKSSDATTRSHTLNNTFKTLLAFALVERNETSEDSSAADSQSSHSVDMEADTLDILRIHGIVQAFFVDSLSEERQVEFWLDRAVAMFCRAFDESKRRVQEDTATGMPDDFRRFAIHGKKLLSHLDRFAKKYASLDQCREDVADRLASADALISELAERNSKAAAQQAEDIASVFERTNSLSETDSESPPSNNSHIDPSFLGDGNTPLESPTTFAHPDYNPYHWHITYPNAHTDYLIVSPPGDSDSFYDGSRTVTPQPPPTEIFDSMTMPDDDEITRRVFGANHRTIRKHNNKRYSDHAGAWRAAPQTVSDPRVSISRETARGGFVNNEASAANHRSGSSSQSGFLRKASKVGADLVSGRATSPKTDAEVSLDKIRSATSSGVPSLRADGTILAEDKPASARPPLRAGRTSYAGIQAATSPTEEHPVPTFANTICPVPAPSSRFTAATIMRLSSKDGEKAGSSPEGFTPVKISSPLTSEPLTASTLAGKEHPIAEEGSEMHRSHESLNRTPRPGTAALSARSSPRSSPGTTIDPFPPPPIPWQVNKTSSLRSSPNTVNLQHPDSAIDEDTDGEPDPIIRAHYPIANLPPLPPYPQGPAIVQHPAPWTTTNLPGTMGYSSQPMSRDPSHQSSHSHGSARSHLSSSPHSSPGPQTMQTPRPRRPPSVVETEPSPRLGPGPFDIDLPVTSYQLYNENFPHYQHHYYPQQGTNTVRNRPRAGSAGEAVMSVSVPPSALASGSSLVYANGPNGPVVTAVPVSPRRLFARLRRSTRRGASSSTISSNPQQQHQNEHRADHRTESAGSAGRISRGTSSNSSRRRRLSRHSANATISSPFPPPPGPAPPYPSAQASGGVAMPAAPQQPNQSEEMVRTSSGGLRLADGTFVQFGSSPTGSSGSNANSPRMVASPSPNTKSGNRRAGGSPTLLPLRGTSTMTSGGGVDVSTRNRTSEGGSGDPPTGLGIQQRRLS